MAIFRTRGCHWSRKGGCSMCGYNVESLEGIGPEEISPSSERSWRGTRARGW